VGFQVARRVVSDLHPERVVIVALSQEAAEGAASRLQPVSGECRVVAEWGDVFLRTEYSRRPRGQLLADPHCREGIVEDLLGPFDAAYGRSRLTRLILHHRPEVIVDSINTATAISYQDVYTAAMVARERLAAGPGGPWEEMSVDVESLILSQSIPQLIRHSLILDRAMREASTRLYLKIGTTGTGGMGLNIPYTHSEDRPSAKLMTKTAVAFAHSGLLFLMARTPGGPLIKEVKPAALIGYGRIAHLPIREGGRPLRRYRARAIELESRLELTMDPMGFEDLGDLEMPVVDTGENGLFTKGEFEAITAIGQMEAVTPEEIAEMVMREIAGGNTGRDVIAAVDGAVMGPSYRAGVLRGNALTSVARLEAGTGTHSVALGQLGPPELSKLLWEAELLRMEFGNLRRAIAADPEDLSARMGARLEARPELRDTITSLGLGILAADGVRMWRGPRLRIPEVAGHTTVEMSLSDRDAWAAKGWVDLRASNWARWQDRFRQMHAAGPPDPAAGSDQARIDSYPFEEIEIGAVVAWVLANELDGYRVM
jgi:hypothetical protein